MARTVTCTNNDGVTITFGETGFTPFLLASLDGIYSTENNITMSENTMTDGGTYQGSIAKVRNIVLTVMDRPENKYALKSRDILRQCFLKGQKGTLTYWENGVSRVIDYVVEYIRPGSSKKRLFIISLLCEDPFFYEKAPVSVYMSNWIPRFEFIHEFSQEGEELGYRSPERLQNIVNDNAADNIGMVIKITANGPASNPTITRVESDEHITIGHSSKSLNLVSGDIITITTETNNKHVYFEHNGVLAEINEYLTEESEFIQLMRGQNNIGYSAESGEGNLVIEISYRLKFEGA